MQNRGEGLVLFIAAWHQLMVYQRRKRGEGSPIVLLLYCISVINRWWDGLGSASINAYQRRKRGEGSPIALSLYCISVINRRGGMAWEQDNGNSIK